MGIINGDNVDWDFNHPQITPNLIPNLPSNIIQFVCGSSQNLFLDSEGNVFSVGRNEHGQLGLGHNTNQNELKKIPNIPRGTSGDTQSVSIFTEINSQYSNIWGDEHNSRVKSARK